MDKIETLITALVRYFQKHLEEAGGVLASLAVWDAGFFSILLDINILNNETFQSVATAFLVGFFGGLGGLLIRLIGKKFGVNGKEKA